MQLVLRCGGETFRPVAPGGERLRLPLCLDGPCALLRWLLPVWRLLLLSLRRRLLWLRLWLCLLLRLLLRLRLRLRRLRLLLWYRHRFRMLPVWCWRRGLYWVWWVLRCLKRLGLLWRGERSLLRDAVRWGAVVELWGGGLCEMLRLTSIVLCLLRWL